MDKYIIVFKSAEPYFSKEEKGIKNNTLRKIDKNDERLEAIKKFIAGECELDIEIHSLTENKKFIRKVRAISVYFSLYIITWEDEKNVRNTSKK